MYAGVPITVPATVCDEPDELDEPSSECSLGARATGSSGAARSFASPQSMTTVSPKSPHITLCGFKSRWITRCECA